VSVSGVSAFLGSGSLPLVVEVGGVLGGAARRSATVERAMDSPRMMAWTSSAFRFSYLRRAWATASTFSQFSSSMDSAWA